MVQNNKNKDDFDNEFFTEIINKKKEIRIKINR